MATITQEMRDCIAATRLCYAATVNPDGTPNLSPKATLGAVDDRHIAFANIASPNTARNLKLNPAIEINVVDIFLRRGFRFAGTARLFEPGSPAYEKFAGETWARIGDGYPIYEIVMVKVESAREVRSPGYDYAGFGDDDSIRSAYCKAYGVQPIPPAKARA
jgi:uncharacterized protein